MLLVSIPAIYTFYVSNVLFYCMQTENVWFIFHIQHILDTIINVENDEKSHQQDNFI